MLSKSRLLNNFLNSFDKSKKPLYSATSVAGVAQLVERNLAKVEVASSRLVSRSNFQLSDVGAIAKRLCTGLQIR